MRQTTLLDAESSIGGIDSYVTTGRHRSRKRRLAACDFPGGQKASSASRRNNSVTFWRQPRADVGAILYIANVDNLEITEEDLCHSCHNLKSTEARIGASSPLLP